MSTNCAEVMAEGYGKRACHKKINANSLSLYIYLSHTHTLSLSISFSVFCFSFFKFCFRFFRYSKEHVAEKIMPKAGIEPLTSR